MKIAIGADHVGKDLKSHVTDFLTLTNHQVLDYGVAADASRSVDYPDFAEIVASEVSAGRCHLGILICGTGIGMSITANKFPNVRAALVYDEFTARMSKEHNNSNILCLGAWALNHVRATMLVKIWLETEFGEGRHKSRLQKIQAIERRLSS